MEIYKKDNTVFQVAEAGDDWYDCMSFDLANNGIGIATSGEVVTSGGYDKLFSDIKLYVDECTCMQVAQDLADNWHENETIKDIAIADDYIESVNGMHDLKVLLNSLSVNIGNSSKFSTYKTAFFQNIAYIWIFNLETFNWEAFAKSKNLTNGNVKMPSLHEFLKQLASPCDGFTKIKEEHCEAVYVMDSAIENKGGLDQYMLDVFGAKKA